MINLITVVNWKMNPSTIEEVIELVDNIVNCRPKNSVFYVLVKINWNTNKD